MDSETLRKAQMRMLEILKIFKKICERNHLSYTLAFGTLLGAVRHNGFIPWDDDIDVCMPRNDYEKFCSLPASEFPSNLVLLNEDTTPYYSHTWAKLVDRNTRWVESANKNVPYDCKSMFIDIFPFDTVKGIGLSLYFRARLINLLSMYLYDKNNYTLTGRSIKKFFYIFLLPFPLTFIRHLRKKLCAGKENGNYFYIFGNGDKYKKDLFDKKKITNCMNILFENEPFSIPADYDFVLHQLYGDYMTLPPEDERVSWHEVIDYEF